MDPPVRGATPLAPCAERRRRLDPLFRLPAAALALTAIAHRGLRNPGPTRAVDPRALQPHRDPRRAPRGRRVGTYLRDLPGSCRLADLPDWFRARGARLLRTSSCARRSYRALFGVGVIGRLSLTPRKYATSTGQRVYHRRILAPNNTHDRQLPRDLPGLRLEGDRRAVRADRAALSARSRSRGRRHARRRVPGVWRVRHARPGQPELCIEIATVPLP